MDRLGLLKEMGLSPVLALRRKAVPTVEAAPMPLANVGANRGANLGAELSAPALDWP